MDAAGAADDGFVNRRGAEAWLSDVLAQAHAGTLPGMVRTGVTFSRAADEWLRYCVEDRACKPSTMVDYRHTVNRVLVPVFGPMLLEDIAAPAIEAWRVSLTTAARTRNKQLTILNGIFRRAQKRFGLQRNPVLEIERMREPRQVNLDVFSPEEVMALVRAAESEQDAAIYLTAAFTGLRRGELIALRWRDVDFAGSVIRVRASYSAGALTTPKSGKLRSVPMAPQVAETLARLGRTATDDALVGEGGGYLDGSASAVATSSLSNVRGCDRSASTTSATPSGPARSARRTSCASKSGLASPTSPPRCATSTTSPFRRGTGWAAARPAASGFPGPPRARPPAPTIDFV